MLHIYNRTYHVWLLDTNAVSEMLKNPTREMRRFFEMAFSVDRTYVAAFSLFTVIELRQRPELYREFLKVFEVIPCVFLKGHEELFTAELQAYPNPSTVEAVSVAFGGIALTENQRLNRVLEKLFATPSLKAKEAEWVRGRASVVKGIASLVKNFPPEKNSYSPREIRTFLEIAGFQQIVLRAPRFARGALNRGEAVQIDAFPSLKMMMFTVFYKFYADKRRPSISDAFDLIISAPTPYVDAIVTESHQAEVIRRIKRQDHFLDHLTVYTLRDLRA